MRGGQAGLAGRQLRLPIVRPNLGPHLIPEGHARKLLTLYPSTPLTFMTLRFFPSPPPFHLLRA